MRRIGLFQILLSGFCFGFLGVFGKWAFELGLGAGEFLAWRFLFAAAGIGAYLGWRNPAELRLPWPIRFRCLILGVAGYAVFSSCYFTALGGLSASLTVLLLYTYPVLVSLGAALFFGEKLRRLHWVALPLVMGGMLLLVWGEFRVRDPFYLAFGALSAVAYASYILASSRWLRKVNPSSSTFYIVLGAGLALGALHLRPEHFPQGAAPWLLLIATAFLSTLLAVAFFLAALQKITSAEASLLSAAEPVTGIALAAFFLGETLSAGQWLGGALVLAGMILVAAGPRPIATPLE